MITFVLSDIGTGNGAVLDQIISLWFEMKAHIIKIFVHFSIWMADKDLVETTNIFSLPRIQHRESKSV